MSSAGTSVSIILSLLGKILRVLVQKHVDLGLLRFSPQIRSYAQFFWNSLASEEQNLLNQKLKASGEVLQYFPEETTSNFVVEALAKRIKAFSVQNELLEIQDAIATANYLFAELQNDDSFTRSTIAVEIQESFLTDLYLLIYLFPGLKLSFSDATPEPS